MAHFVPIPADREYWVPKLRVLSLLDKNATAAISVWGLPANSGQINANGDPRFSNEGPLRADHRGFTPMPALYANAVNGVATFKTNHAASLASIRTRMPAIYRAPGVSYRARGRDRASAPPPLQSPARFVGREPSGSESNR